MIPNCATCRAPDWYLKISAYSAVEKCVRCVGEGPNPAYCSVLWYISWCTVEKYVCVGLVWLEFSGSCCDNVASCFLRLWSNNMCISCEESDDLNLELTSITDSLGSNLDLLRTHAPPSLMENCDIAQTNRLRQILPARKTDWDFASARNKSLCLSALHQEGLRALKK